MGRIEAKLKSGYFILIMCMESRGTPRRVDWHRLIDCLVIDA